MNSFHTEQDTDMNDSSISSWILHDLEDSTTELGEDMISSILESIDYD